MSKKFDKLVVLLKELFQLDQPDLDFGLYRIMHAKADEITQFLEGDLLPQVQEAFNHYITADKAVLEEQLKMSIEQANNLGVDPETTAKVKELRQKITDESIDVAALETEVYDYLYSFFRRYYDDGDFLAKRVYKPGVYAVPYEGEEVKLHWANRDQYYIKTSEYLRDYAFTLRPAAVKDPMRVHFRLAHAAEGEHGNAKVPEGKDRIFVLAPNDFVAEENGELVLRFHYRPATIDDWPEEARQAATAAAAKKPPFQKVLLADAVRRILAVADPALKFWIDELSKKHVKANGETVNYSRLEGHLNRYCARHTFDYFIHKDLGRFLRCELDFFIKNEIMHLDDVESESAPHVEQYLSKIKVIRKIAHKLIEFLAQLEDFQKKLWLKKKFVVETSYCIRLGHVPEEFYPEIAANRVQLAEWVTLCAIDALTGNLGSPPYTAPLTRDFMKSYPSLMIDTRHFSADFTTRLVGTMTDLESATDGLLIYGENYQALALLQQRFEGRIRSIYIDPPYNTDASAIVYKNNYKTSSWMSLIADRVTLCIDLLDEVGIFTMAIDDQQVSEARLILEPLFDKALGLAVVRSNPQSRKSKETLSPTHEYALFYGRSSQSIPGRLELTDKRLARYPKRDDKGHFSWMHFIRTGTNDRREDRPKLFYPIFVSHDDSLRIPDMQWSADVGKYGEYVLKEQPKDTEVVIYPVVQINRERVEKNWHRGHERVATELGEYRVRRDVDGAIKIDFKTRIDEESTPVTWWDKPEYASANYGAAELKALFGNKPFDFPKALNLVADCLRASNVEAGTTVLDYFGGSGTTAHAIVQLNREDDGRRRFILVENGTHFDSVILPRIKKITYGPEWKDGKPTRSATKKESDRGPRVIKVIRLESYEDALNNLIRVGQCAGESFGCRRSGRGGWAQGGVLAALHARCRDAR